MSIDERELEADLGGDLSNGERTLIEDVALDTLLIHGLNARRGVAAVHKGRINPVYRLRAQLIAQRREHLNSWVQSCCQSLSLNDILAANDNDDTPANINGAVDGDDENEGVICLACRPCTGLPA